MQDIHYTHDPVGNIVEIVDNAQQIHYFSNSVIEPRAMYKYDALYRLKEATGRELASLQLPTHSDFANNIPVPNMGNNAMQNYTQQFTYDELGNILQMKSVGRWTRDYHYDILHNNYLTGHTPRAIDYTYDAHGNMLSMPHLQSMHYDHLNQLNKVVLDASGNTAYYIYDAGGQRARKVVEKGYVREERIYVGGYEVFRKYENSTLDLERSTVHIMDDKNRVALIEKLKVYEGETVSGSEQIRYQYSNHLGSASLELNATGQIISYEEYHPFGTTSYRSGSNETEVSLKRYKYIGKERDEETGLYYYGFRYYAAWIARFINVDPLQHEYPHYTPFQYAGNKPVTYVDLDGLEEAKVDETNNPTPPNGYKYILVKGENGVETNVAVQDLQIYEHIGKKLSFWEKAGKFITKDLLPNIPVVGGIYNSIKSFAEGDILGGFMGIGEALLDAALLVFTGGAGNIAKIGIKGLTRYVAKETLENIVAGQFQETLGDAGIPVWAQITLGVTLGVRAGKNKVDDNLRLANKVDDAADAANVLGKETIEQVGKNFNRISDSLLKKSGIDAHQLKRDFLGKKAKISQYDLYKDTKTGEILILQKGGKGNPIQTGEFLR